ncbi:MAG: M56 family metallopeptidase, partial [Eubacterium sp.]|nr:M56 family metallopeptidase [Eubacterium sp.]
RILKMEKVLDSHSTQAGDAEEILRTIDGKCDLEVKRSKLIKGPVILGYLHPVIYLPDMSFSQKNLTDILRHEYTHWKRHHLAIKFILQCITFLFWWNPCIYLLRKDITHLIELICDEIAMTPYHEQEKLHYMTTILQCLKHSAGMNAAGETRDCALGFAAVMPGYTTKQRLTYHMNKTPLATRKRYQIYLLNGIAIFWMLASYFVILQPFYNPEKVQSYSNEENSYLVESADGSYEFHYDGYVVPVSRESVEEDGYYIYTIIPYEEYKDLGSYEEAETYLKYMENRKE